MKHSGLCLRESELKQNRLEIGLRMLLFGTIYEQMIGNQLKILLLFGKDACRLAMGNMTLFGEWTHFESALF